MLGILCCMQVYLTIHANSALENKWSIFCTAEVLKYQNAAVPKDYHPKKNINYVKCEYSS